MQHDGATLIMHSRQPDTRLRRMPSKHPKAAAYNTDSKGVAYPATEYTVEAVIAERIDVLAFNAGQHLAFASCFTTCFQMHGLVIALAAHLHGRLLRQQLCFFRRLCRLLLRHRPGGLQPVHGHSGV